MPSLLLLDNYDSFTYNVVHAFYKLGIQNIDVIQNDKLSVQDCLQSKPSYIIIGPGPGNPTAAGISLELIKAAAHLHIPLLGICLGMQAIAEAFGGKVKRAIQPKHGKISKIRHNDKGLFAEMPRELEVMRYHSLIVETHSLPEVLEVTAWTDEGEMMGLRHRSSPMEGVQFHPESVATASGLKLLENWIKRIK